MIRARCIRRPSPFERIFFLGAVLLGFGSVALSVDVSPAIAKAWPAGSSVYWIVLGICGLMGVLATWRDTDVPEKLKTALFLERAMLALSGLMWSAYAVVAATSSGSIFGIGFVFGGALTVSSILRIREIYSDIRLLTEAQHVLGGTANEENCGL